LWKGLSLKFGEIKKPRLTARFSFASGGKTDEDIINDRLLLEQVLTA